MCWSVLQSAAVSCIHAYIHAYMHACITYVHAYMHECIRTCKHVYMHKYKHTYIYVYIHTHKHIYTHAHIHTLSLHYANLMHSRVSHDSFTRVTWLIRKCDMTDSHAWHYSIMTHPHVWRQGTSRAAWQRPLMPIFPPFPYFFLDIKGGMTYMQTYIQMCMETFSQFPAIFYIFFSILFPDKSQGRHDNNARPFSVNQRPLLQWAYDYDHCCKFFFFFCLAYVRVAESPRLQRNKIEFRVK